MFLQLTLSVKKDLYNYMIGLYQATTAALLAAAIIVPDTRTEALIGSAACSILGLLTIHCKNKLEE